MWIECPKIPQKVRRKKYDMYVYGMERKVCKDFQRSVQGTHSNGIESSI
jgi:hypothetical protein